MMQHLLIPMDQIRKYYDILIATSESPYQFPSKKMKYEHGKQYLNSFWIICPKNDYPPMKLYNVTINLLVNQWTQPIHWLIDWYM